MDVTSMLNTAVSTGAAEQPKQETPITLPTRNRTPWDAGGYVLPILSKQSHKKQIQPNHQPDFNEQSEDGSQMSENSRTSDELPDITTDHDRFRQNFSADVGIESIRHPKEDTQLHDGVVIESKFRSGDPLPVQRHRISDSRGSLSSFASSLSLNSATHSRFSSTSTVSGYHPLNTINDDGFTEEKRRQAQFQQGGRSPLIFSPLYGHPRSHSVASAIEPLSTLALIAERRSQEDLNTTAELEMIRLRGRLPAEATGSSENSKENAYGSRSASPSDAILIKRTTFQDLTSPPHPHERKSRLYEPPNHISGPEDKILGVPKSTHKRTSSAPNYLQPPRFDTQPEMMTSRPGPRSEPTPPCSAHPYGQSPDREHFVKQTPDTPPEHHAAPVIPEPRCMYIVDCDTNSTPRKAISHLLGRNKMCTRLIPAHIWVQYCRKHYQRARYRNMGGWPPLQCELVQEQIRRLETWSNENAAKGSGPIVKDWALALRKREQTRRDRLTKVANKSNGSGGLDNDSEGEAVEEVARNDRGSDNPPQAVPTWLFDMVGSGYSNADISSIFDRIHEDILAKKLPNMPDIEILPNILVDREASKDPKGYVKRKPVAHQRSRSLGGAALRSENHWASLRRNSQPVVWEAGPIYSLDMSPSTKRKRFDDFEEDSYPQPMHVSQRMRGSTYDMGPHGHGPSRRDSGWVDGPPSQHSAPLHSQSMSQHQHQQQQQNQQQQYPQHQQQQQQHAHNRHLMQTSNGYVDEMYARNSYYQPQPAPTQNYSPPQSYSHQNQGSISAPQPLRQPYMSTAQHLDHQSESHSCLNGGPSAAARPHQRRMAPHQRSRSDMSFMRSQADGSFMGGHPSASGMGYSSPAAFSMRKSEERGLGGEGGESMMFRR